MLIAEYSYEKDIQVKQREAREYGRALGRKEERLLLGKIFQLIRKSPDITDSQAAEVLGCTPEDVGDARKLFGI